MSEPGLGRIYRIDRGSIDYITAKTLRRKDFLEAMMRIMAFLFVGVARVDRSFAVLRMTAVS